jgi:hypothetical protein
MDDLLKELDSFDRSAPADRDRRRRFVATAAIAGLAFVGLGQLTTSALFEDSAAASVSIASGDVEIEANGLASTTLAAASNMAPGDTVYRPVSITNAGSLDLRYAITAQTTAETKQLSDVLRYSVYGGVSAASCNTAGVASLTPAVANVAVGTGVSPLLGSTVQGAQGGDRPIAAGAGADEICVGITLPFATTSAYAAASATVELTFNAEQTKNN